MLKAVILSALFLKVLATKIYFSNVITSFDSNYTNFTAVISKDRVSINGTIVSFYDLSKMTMTFIFSIPKNDHDKNYDLTIVNSKILSCKLMQGTRGNFIVRMLLDDFNKFVNTTFPCPFPKQIYGFYNFKPSEKYLPPLLLNRDIKFKLIVKTDGKLMNSSNAVWLYSMKLHGEIKSG